MCLTRFFADIVYYSNDAKTTHYLNLTHYKCKQELADRHVKRRVADVLQYGFRF